MHPSLSVQTTTLRTLRFRLIPFLFLLYIVCYLDRVNVGFAALEMNRDLGFSPSVYGFGAGVFFLGYALLEVPSNLLLSRVGARRWIARIMISWGVLASAMALVRGPRSFYILRFLLGAAEAGFFPGIIFYLSQWFPAGERSRANAAFLTAIPISGILGSPISGALLEMDGTFGLRGWQWLFVVEGIPSVLLGVVVLWHLTDRPSEAKWLSLEQRRWLAERMLQEQRRRKIHHDLNVRRALTNGTVWQLALVAFTIQIGLYSLTLWLPQFVRALFDLNEAMIGVLTAVPYVLTATAMITVGMHASGFNHQIWHVTLLLVAAAFGFAASAYLHSPVAALLALSVTLAGVLSALGPFWSFPSAFLSNSAAAAGIAMINSVAAISGFVGPYLVGLLNESNHSYRTSFLMLAFVTLVGATIILRLHRLFASLGTPLAAAPRVGGG